MTKPDLDAFLASAATDRTDPTKRCSTCVHAAAPVIVDFLDKKAAGLTHLSLEHVRERFLAPTLGYPNGRTSLHRHVKKCLHRDVSTGLPYDPSADPDTMARIESLKTGERDE